MKPIVLAFAAALLGQREESHSSPCANTLNTQNAQIHFETLTSFCFR